jgi:hypothetical protein
MSINGNLFVGRDLSYNGNLYVRENSIDPNAIRYGINNNFGIFQYNYVTPNTALYDADGFGVLRNIDSTSQVLYSKTDISLNGNLYAQGKMGIGTVSPSGALHIYEPTGTVLTPTTASIILEHGDLSGTSSILFKSRNNPNSDYGYIYYLDDIFETVPNGANLTERCALCIGVENDEGSLISGTLNNDVLVLNRGGCYVGVGKTNPATALDVNGTTTSTAFNATSDYRIKTNVLSLQDTTMTIDNLRPVMYTNTLTNKEDIGFIAHEVQEHIPFLVFGEKDGEHHQSINYNGMIGILTREIQDLKKENRNLQQRLALLESKLL